MRRTVATLAVAAALLAVPHVAAEAAVQHGLGHATTPAQPYLNNPDTSDWLGSYVVNGEPVYVVQFAYLAPDSDEEYQAGGTLKTKWNTDLPPDVAADIGYLLLAHGGTQDADTAAALAHLLQSWTAAPQNPGQLDPSNDFRHIAYDAPFHLAKLPAGAQAKVTALRDEAAAQRGPWTVEVTAPAGTQVGRSDVWTVHARTASGGPVVGRPVTLSATGADLAATSVVLDGNGDASVALTPTQVAVGLSASLESPADTLSVQEAVQVDTARVIGARGNSKTLSATAASTAAPGAFSSGPQATVKGRPRVGKLLTASAGTTVPAGTVTFQWLAGGSVVGTGPAYRVSMADLGKSIQATASVARDGYTSAHSTSPSTKPVKLPKAALVVQAPRRAVLGTRVLVRARGLAPGEACTVHFGGETVSDCTANAAGKVRVRLAVEGVAPGKRKVVVQGAIPRRRGVDVIRVAG
jgi:hypothetical protein